MPEEQVQPEKKTVRELRQMAEEGVSLSEADKKRVTRGDKAKATRDAKKGEPVSPPEDQLADLAAHKSVIELKYSLARAAFGYLGIPEEDREKFRPTDKELEELTACQLKAFQACGIKLVANKYIAIGTFVCTELITDAKCAKRANIKWKKDEEEGPESALVQ